MDNYYNATEMKKKNLKYITIISLCILVIALVTSLKPKHSNVLIHKFSEGKIDDTLINDQRHVGNISLEKFIALATKAQSTDFDSTCVVVENDSALIIVKVPFMFYGNDDGDWWLTKFKDLPINILPNLSFKAKINEINNVQYMYIPYQIISCLIDFIGDENSNSIENNFSEKLRDKDGNYITIRPTEDINDRKLPEYLTESESKVHKNISDILSQNSDRSGSKYKQINILWKHVYQNWIYVHDPAVAKDTWRPAAQTIDSYYSTANKKYTGDCDDFAILMASMAKDIGLPSRMICAVNSEGGHAYSEFFVPNDEIDVVMSEIGHSLNYIKEDKGIWVNMDWGSNKIGGKYFDGKRVRTISDF